MLLLTEGPYHQAFIDDKTKKMNFVYTALDFEFRWISLSFLMQNGTFIFNLMYLAFSLQGLFQSPIFYSFHLLDMIVSTTASLFSFCSLSESIPAATERYQECHEERLPALHDGNAGLDLHIHLLDYRIHLPLRHVLQ